jgi:hypothetical protein
LFYQAWGWDRKDIPKRLNFPIELRCIITPKSYNNNNDDDSNTIIPVYLFYHLHHLHRFKILIILQSVRNGFSGSQLEYFQTHSARLRKALVSSCLSVRSCVSLRPHGSTRLSLDWFSRKFILEYFWNICGEKINLHWNLTRLAGPLSENLCMTRYDYVSLRFFKMKNVSDRSCRENNNAYFTLRNILKDNTIWRIACWITKATDLHSYS